MLTAAGARQIASDRFTLGKLAIDRAIHKAARDGQFRVEFDYDRWPGQWAEEWLEELGYDWNLIRDTVEVSWVSEE